MPAAVRNGSRSRGENGQKSQRLSLFLRSSVFDFLLVLIVSTGLVYTVSYGFNSAPDLRGNVLLEAGVCAVLLIVLFAGAWSKRALLPCAICYLVLAAIVLALLGASEPAGTPFFANGQVNDVEGNYYVFGLVLVLVPLVTYLLSRRTWGVAILFILGVLACAVIQFFYRDWISSQPGVLASLVVYLGCGACYINQRYRASVYSAKRIGRAVFGGACGFSLVTALICLLVGVAVFFGIIAGLNLSTPNFKPFQDYYQRPVVEYTGVYSRKEIVNPDIKTSNINEDKKNDTRKNAEGGTQQDTETQNGTSASQEEKASKSPNGYDSSDWNQQFQTIGYNLSDWHNLVLIALVVAAIIAVIVLRRRQRTRRLEKIADKPVSEQVIWIYEFLLTRFKRLGIRKPESLTPMEFALASANQLEPYVDLTTKTDFLQVTLAYMRAGYGDERATKEDLKRVKSYYRTFYKNVSKQVGKVKWLWKFWRI
ncbi:MAG: DUF4129 domain-containing protein [Coriobacteriales bacterium]|jgi:hypothetical protein